MSNLMDKELKHLMRGQAVNAGSFVWPKNQYKGTETTRAHRILRLSPGDQDLDQILSFIQTLLVSYGYKLDKLNTNPTGQELSYQGSPEYTFIASGTGLVPDIAGLRFSRSDDTVSESAIIYESEFTPLADLDYDGAFSSGYWLPGRAWSVYNPSEGGTRFVNIIYDSELYSWEKAGSNAFAGEYTPYLRATNNLTISEFTPTFNSDDYTAAAIGSLRSDTELVDLMLRRGTLETFNREKDDRARLAAALYTLAQ